jgi:hypothetical protein
MTSCILHSGVKDTPETKELVKWCQKNGVRVVRT